ncbi:MAG TPA: hypothetical protein VLC29_06295 [Rhizomicrobium sp.]|jgi:hypothetical protein|nr:hypothetical protein [Rhizomicrobium sp.]
MRKTTKVIAGVLASVAMTTQAFAGGVCSRAEETAGVKAEILQQQLMVAAYSCHMEGAYNAFVVNYRPDLIAADGAAQSLFQRASAQGADQYQTFKTQLANDFSLDSQNQDGFCDNAQSMFEQAAEHRGQSLSGLMDALNFDGATPFDQCSVREAAVSRDTDDGMVEGGSSGAVAARTAR